MTRYKLSAIAHILGSTTSVDRDITALLTDSRSITPRPEEALFFALRTHKGNGHKYIRELYAKGVRAFVISEDYPDEGCPGATFIRVKDTLKALQTLARHHREKLSCPVVGITGSAGKTTIKELLFSLLSKGLELNVGRSPQSYNSALGVPLSLWQIDPHSDLALIEAGISEPGEMDLLADLIRPEIGLFTGIGDAHSENFPSLLSKASEKLKLFHGVETLYLSDDTQVIAQALDSFRLESPAVTIKRWSTTDHEADLFVEAFDELPSGTTIKYRIKGEKDPRSITVAFHERGLLEDTALALLFLHYRYPSLFESPEDELPKLFKDLPSGDMRMDIQEGENDTLLVLPWGSNAPLEHEALRNALSFIRKRRLSHSARLNKPTAVVLIDENEAKDETEANKRRERYTSIAQLIEVQRGDDLPSAHKVIAIGAGIKPYTELLGKGGEIHTFRTVSDFLSWDKDSSPEVLSEGFLSSGALTALSGHLILLLPPFSSRGHSLVSERPIPPLHHLILEAFKAKSHQTILRVNLSALRSNLNALRALLPDRQKAKVCAMIKAFGYGVGSYEIAKEFEDEGVEYLAVAVSDEGKELREKGIRTPIIVMNPESSAFIQMIRYRLEPNIYSMTLLRSFGNTVAALGITGYPIHISIDTGMHRLGFEETEIPGLLRYLSSLPEESTPLKVASIFTHLSKADMRDENSYTLSQLEMISRVRQTMAKGLPYPFLTHALNTAGLMRFPQYAFDMVRMGIGLYGLSPLDETTPSRLKTPLRPVASLETVILQTRTLPAGSTVGYGNSGRLERDSRIGVIPIGYADGFPRSLGRGAVSFRVEGGVLAPTVGNICMDATMIDLTDAPLAVEGSKVILFGESPDVSIDRLAKVENPPLGTIHYEVLARLSKRIARTYYHE